MRAYDLVYLMLTRKSLEGISILIPVTGMKFNPYPLPVKKISLLIPYLQEKISSCAHTHEKKSFPCTCNNRKKIHLPIFAKKNPLPVLVPILAKI